MPPFSAASRFSIAARQVLRNVPARRGSIPPVRGPNTPREALPVERPPADLPLPVVVLVMARDLVSALLVRGSAVRGLEPVALRLPLKLAVRSALPQAAPAAASSNTPR